ncbi:MAG TPA: hypothetical protein VGR09_15355, partial [Gemmatimonadales bacterium]|nr:hypothetical protein [Gemmatimonadales bacterium]
MRARLLGAAIWSMAIVAGGASSLAAQETQDTTRLPELIVTPTKLPTRPDAVVSSVTTISGDDLKARGIRFVQ